MHKLRVNFGEPDNGWLPVEVSWKDVCVSFVASYVYSSIEMLIEVLRSSLVGQGQYDVVWNSEPTEYVMQFRNEGDAYSFTILQYPDNRRPIFTGQSLLKVVGTYGQTALPFWRALRSLQGRYAEPEWKERWREPFPTEALRKLTHELEKQGVTHATQTRHFS